MVREIRVYLEGGGDSSDTKSRLRQGFGEFLRDLRGVARSKEIKWSIVACGRRRAAYDCFRAALKCHPSAFNVLLVDSESAVSRSPWQHLRDRDEWALLDSSLGENVHLMAQAMEAWFLADRVALAGYYGRGFNESVLPGRPDVEQVPKSDLEAALKNASRDTTKGQYHKGRHGPKLLELIDPQNVRRAARHCERLFDVLSRKMGGTL